MHQFNFLILEGNAYKIKKTFSLIHLVLLCWLSIGLAVLFFSTKFKLGLVITVFALLLFALVLFKSSKTRIVPTEKRVQIDTGIRGQQPIQYQFSAIDGFHIHLIQTKFGLPLHATLYIQLTQAEQKKRYEIGSSLRPKSMQRLREELEEIMSNKK